MKSWKRDDGWYSLIERQDTQPLPKILPHRPNLQQLRQFCDMGLYELAHEAKVRLCRVRWMETGIACSYQDVMSVLRVLSKHSGYPLRIEDVRGLRIREFDELQL